MIRIRRSDDRGYADHGWLKTYHTFSFANYHAPEFMGFGVLRVINQDRVQPAHGFGTHSHENMEIVTYVLEGVLEHKDSLGGGSQLRPGEVQLMSAGTGVTHSEFNASTAEELEFLQMWVLPERRDTVPRYEQRFFPESDRRGRLCPVISPCGRDGSISIGQDVTLYASLLAERDRVRHDLDPRPLRVAPPRTRAPGPQRPGTRPRRRRGSSRGENPGSRGRRQRRVRSLRPPLTLAYMEKLDP